MRLNFSGTHKEIGQQIGRLYRSWGKKELHVPTIDGAVYEQQLVIYRQYFPMYLEWLEGVAVGAGFHKDDTLKSYISGFLNLKSRPRNTCSVFGLHKNGKVYIGRDYDWRAASEESSEQLSVQFTDGSYSFTGLTDMATWAVGAPADRSSYVVVSEDAWNEHGLFVCINGAPGLSADMGMSCLHIVQATIEQCRNTAEAVELITKIPCNDPKLFTVVDKSGDMAVIEKPTHREAVVVRSNEQVIATNHFQSEALFADNAQIFEHVPFHSTFARYAYLKASLARLDEPKIEQIRDIILRPPVIQNWRGVENGDTVTVWTEALELVSGENKIILAPLKSKNLA